MAKRIHSRGRKQVEHKDLLKKLNKACESNLSFLLQEHKKKISCYLHIKRQQKKALCGLQDTFQLWKNSLKGYGTNCCMTLETTNLNKYICFHSIACKKLLPLFRFFGESDTQYCNFSQVALDFMQESQLSFSQFSPLLL